MTEILTFEHEGTTYQVDLTDPNDVVTKSIRLAMTRAAEKASMDYLQECEQAWDRCMAGEIGFKDLPFKIELRYG